MRMVIDDVTFICNEDIPFDEAKEYVRRGFKKYGSFLAEVNAIIDGDFVDLNYQTINHIPLERIRRIIGHFPVSF